MLSAINNFCKAFFRRIKETIKNFTKSETVVIAAGAVSYIMRGHKDLVTENVILRQQLIVLKRKVERPKFTNSPRSSLVFLSCLTQ